MTQGLVLKQLLFFYLHKEMFRVIIWYSQMTFSYWSYWKKGPGKMKESFVQEKDVVRPLAERGGGSAREKESSSLSSLIHPFIII